jgi:hypothetical protein
LPTGFGNALKRCVLAVTQGHFGLAQRRLPLEQLRLPSSQVRLAIGK